VPSARRLTDRFPGAVRRPGRQVRLAGGLALFVGPGGRFGSAAARGCSSGLAGAFDLKTIVFGPKNEQFQVKGEDRRGQGR
jgi:hypothetical protein